MIYAKNYTIYKPNMKGTGSALNLDLSQNGLFLEITRQVEGERKFDWDNKITVKLDLVDIAKILLGFKTLREISIFHNPDARNQIQGERSKTVNMKFSKEYGCYYLRVGYKVKESVQQIGIPINLEEAIIMDELLRFAIPRLVSWERVEVKGRERTEEGEDNSQVSSRAQEAQSNGQETKVSKEEEPEIISPF